MQAPRLQLVLDLVEAGIDAIVVDARRAGHADAADHLIAGLDRLAARNGDDVRQSHLLMRDRVGILQLLDVFRGRLSEGHRGIGFAPRILHRMRRSLVAMHSDDGVAVAIHHHRRNRIALDGAGRHRTLGNGLGDVQ